MSDEEIRAAAAMAACQLGTAGNRLKSDIEQLTHYIATGNWGDEQ